VGDSLFYLNSKQQNIQKAPSGADKKTFDYHCYQSIVMLTSILLSMEQLQMNEFNPNRHSLPLHRKDEKNAEYKMQKHVLSKTCDVTTLEDRVYQNINGWLQQYVFLDKRLPIEIRITFLQLIYQIIEFEGYQALFKQNLIVIISFNDCSSTNSYKNPSRAS